MAETRTPAAPDRALVEMLVLANRILADQGVVDGFGHASARHDSSADHFLLSRQMAPGLVSAEDIVTFDLGGTPVPDTGQRHYLERFIHSEIYRARPDVKAVIHCHAPSLIPFGVSKTPLRAIYHVSSFLGSATPVFEIRTVAAASDTLIRTPELGRALAAALGAAPVVLMRGHGATMVGASLPQAVFRGVYAAMNATLQAEAMRLGEVTYLSDEEARLATETNNAVIDRSWNLWAQQVAKR